MDPEHALLNVSLLVGAEIDFIVGLLTDLFIVVVNVIDWKKAGTLTTADHVIISMTISKMFLQCIIQLNIFWGSPCVTYYLVSGFLINVGYDSAIYSFIWFCTLLSVVHYLKISNLHSIFLLNLRIIISKRILHIIAAIVFVSVGLSSVGNGIHYKSYSQNSTRFFSYIDTQLDRTRVALLMLFNMAPLVICFLASALLIFSLCFHVNQMKGNKNLTSSLVVYYRTMKCTGISAINCAMYVCINFFIQSYYCFFGVIIPSFTLSSLLTFHSIYMIFATAKLKKWLSKILHHLQNQEA
ncbi:taste receptor type 2 member 9-like [Dendrobates tinctorius]|uniref:taste receptor type 2 member 9-like n=1 Tax=Dendrobates tinctorius TaxID=92724 RepID=UPI003CC9484A